MRRRISCLALRRSATISRIKFWGDKIIYRDTSTKLRLLCFPEESGNLSTDKLRDCCQVFARAPPRSLCCCISLDPAALHAECCTTKTAHSKLFELDVKTPHLLPLLPLSTEECVRDGRQPCQLEGPLPVGTSRSGRHGSPAKVASVEVVCSRPQQAILQCILSSGIVHKGSN